MTRPSSGAGDRPTSRRPLTAALAFLIVACGSSPAVAGRSGLDEAARSWAQDHQRRWVFAVLEQATRLGDVRIAVTVLLAIMLFSRRGRTAGVTVVVVVTVAALGVMVPTLQHVVARTGPTGASPPAVSGAWPSGHAMTATVACLLVAGIGPWAAGRRVGAVVCAEAVTAVVGFGLVYCNFHWLTDVVSGVALAHLCVLGGTVCAQWCGFDVSPRRSAT